jgi:hypothetical protein
VCLLKDEQDPTVVIFDIDRGDDEQKINGKEYQKL